MRRKCTETVIDNEERKESFLKIIYYLDYLHSSQISNSLRQLTNFFDDFDYRNNTLSHVAQTLHLM